MFDEKHYEEKVYENREYVDMSELKEEFLNTIRYSLEENFFQAQEFAEKEKEKLKEFFIREITRLELLMKKRVDCSILSPSCHKLNAKALVIQGFFVCLF